jgi:hypothetical protein
LSPGTFLPAKPTHPDFEPGDEIDWSTELRPSPAGEELLVVAPVLKRWLGKTLFTPAQLRPPGR